MASITAIEGVTDRQADTLRAAGISTSDALLESANTAKRRERLAAETKISEKSLLKWAQQADLMRVTGVSAPAADLLTACGVTSVKDLKGQPADDLAASLAKANSRRRNPTVKRPPSAKVVQKWIDASKGLRPVVRA